MIKLPTLKDNGVSPLDLVYNLVEFDGCKDSLLIELYNSLSPVRYPTTQHCKKPLLKWLYTATTSKDVRYYLQWLHAAAGWLVGTDGHRLHAAASGLCGTYELQKAGKKLDLEQVENEPFTPRAVRVFKDAERDCLRNPDSGLLLSYWDQQRVFVGDVYICIEDSHERLWFYKYDYLYDAITVSESIKCHIADDGKLLLTITENQKAIIMPRICGD